MSGAIREVFKEVMRGAGRQGWLIGHMDAASRSLEVVLDDLNENARRNPKHELTHSAMRDIIAAQQLIDGVAAKLEKVASGEE